MNATFGKIIILIGGLLVVAGLFIYFFHDKLRWLGHLPGDIRIERENFRFYFPLATCLLLTLLLNLVIWLVRRFW